MQGKKSILSIVILLAGLAAFGQKPGNAPLPLSTQQQFVQSKNYYLLTLFGQSPQVKKMLESDPILSRFASAETDSLRQSLLSCKNSICFAEKAKFTAAEIRLVADRLSKLYRPENALGLLVKQQLIPSGKYGLYGNLKPEAILQKAWEQDAHKIPFDKPFLTSTTKGQSFAITNMAARCEKELHYVPYKPGKRLSDTDQEFYPVKEAWQINADEPLDP
ncbi:MAG: hypothetical protein V5804_13520 [Mucilaginibacter sp.]|uniref:hypothetical protein n=1 Tax=Mucilaginibacter sp. TaxID=1882438 RepID=UPI0034E602D5